MKFNRSVPSAEISRIKLRYHHSIVIALVLTAVFCSLTGIGLHHWYSNELVYQNQVHALLSGHFALNKSVSGLPGDIAWGNGAQQVWGLGVPFFRLPFDLLARLFGQQAFPDRAVLLLAVFLVSLLLVYSLKNLSPGKITALTLLSVTLEAAFFILAPVLLFVAQFSDTVYEEAITYAYLINLAQLGLFIVILKRYSFRALCFIALLSGLAPYFRPTAFVYSALSFGLSLFVAYRREKRLLKLLLPTFIFFVTFTSLLVSNYYRFGGYTEFGHSLNTSKNPITNYLTKIDSPSYHMPFISLIQELTGAMFFMDRLPFRTTVTVTGIHPGQSDAVRFRDYYFPSYSRFTLVLLILFWALFPFLSFRRRKRAVWFRRSETALYLWSLGSFLLMFLFYLWSPCLSSRYFCDFGPAVSLSIFLLLREVSGRISRCEVRSCFPWNARLLSDCSLDFWTLLLLGCAVSANILWVCIAPSKSHSPIRMSGKMSTEAKEVSLPSRYESRMALEKFRISRNGVGWDHNCKLAVSTLFFINDSQIVTLELFGDDGSLEESLLRNITVVKGIKKMALTDIQRGNGTATLRFELKGPSAPKDPIQLLAIGWSSFSELRSIPPFKLKWIEVSRS